MPDKNKKKWKLLMTQRDVFPFPPFVRNCVRSIITERKPTRSHDKSAQSGARQKYGTPRIYHMTNVRSKERSQVTIVSSRSP